MNIYKMLMAIMRVIRLSRRIMRVSYRVRHQSSHKRFRHKNRAVWGLAILVVLMAFSSCDDYQPADNAIHVGYILCENHSCMRPTFLKLPIRPWGLFLQNRRKTIRSWQSC